VKARGERTIATTTQLVEALRPVTPPREENSFLAQVFQALRIAVNGELDEIARGLRGAVERLAPGGRLAVISFHSLEDRLVKEFMRESSRDCVCPPQQPVCTCGAQPALRLVSRKAIKATDEEIAANARSRSARLRVTEKIGN